MQSHTLSGSGGSSKANYLFSLGYLNQEGTLIETFLKRYSARINTQFKPGKHIRFGENAYVFYKQNPGFNNLSEGNAISHAYRIMPVIPVHDIKGNYGGTWLGPEFGEGENSVAIQENTKNNKNNFWAITGNVYGEVDFLNHFTLRSNFGGNTDNQYSYFISPNRYHSKQDHFSENSFSENAQYNTNYTWTNTLNYGNTFGRHVLNVIVGSEAVKNNGRSLSGSANNFFSLDPNYLILGNGTSSIRNGSGTYVNTLYSLFGRVDYSFNDKYILGATIRRDGSSVFGADKRYGVFPSVSAGWRVTGEKFMQNISFVNNLKLRGSYGVLGSQANVSPSNAFSLYGGSFGSSYYDITGSSNSIQQGFRQTRIGNHETGWEENIVTNIGMDARVLNNHLDISVDWFKKSINGLLFPLPLSASAGGAAAPTINTGDIQNKGWDFSVTYNNRGSMVSYNIGLNVGFYKNLVVKIPDPGYFDVAGSRIGNIVRNQVDHPVGSFFGYEVIGLFQSDDDVTKSPTQTDAAPGRFKYKDVNGDNKITPDDRTFFGDPNPDFTYGLNLGANFKGFDISAILYGSYGNDVFNLVRYYTEFMGTSVGRAKSNVLKNAWSPSNTNSSVPILESASSFSTNGVINSYYKENGSFLKLRSLVIGYTINPGLLKKIGVNDLRFYLQGVNLFTITKYKGLDPELTGNLGGTQSSAAFGIDYGNYPNNQKNILFGLNLKF
ncbi:MAG: SusC/RagA family TonB-linked outer membrane protein [Bacteroidota bacterium]|nr:SusC/RagA family TonB-linked outer membrane protein [Bacteroidota bacterium]